MKKLFITAFLINMIFISALSAGEKKQIKMLFYGNSFTGMHNVPLLVKQVAESGQPDLEIDYMTALHGGKTLKHHWDKYGNHVYFKLPGKSTEELKVELTECEKNLEAKKKDGVPYRQRVTNYSIWLEWMKASGSTSKLDYVVLQVYKDERGELKSPYAVYARKFVKEAQKLGIKPILL